MPQIHLKQPGLPVADFAVYGTVVTVAGVAIDCAARQQDGAVVVEIRLSDLGPSEGGDGAYLAQIAIPARRFDEIETEDGVQRLPQPLDPNAVEITLWPAA